MKLVNYFIYVIIIFVCIDLIFRHIFNLGMPVIDSFGAYNGYNRYPVPYMGFINRELLQNQISYDYATYWNKDEDVLKVAFFGGSTGQNISDTYFSEKLSELLNTKVQVVNFSAPSAHHREHLHMIIELLPKYNPDLVVFYGGVNEGTQFLMFDPRPGYPHNAYYKMETSPLKQLLIENSALVSSLELKYENITNVRKIKEIYYSKFDDWMEEIKNKYFETLELSKNVTETLHSDVYGKTQFIAFYQPYKIDEMPEFKKTHNEIREKIKDITYIVDVFDSFNGLDDNIWFDYCHVNDEASRYIVDIMSEIIAKKFSINNKDG